MANIIVPRDPASAAEEKRVKTHVLIAGTARGLDLFRRVPALMEKRRWPADQGLADVLIAAAALAWLHVGAAEHGATVLRRPPAADGLQGLWPAEAETLTPRAILTILEIEELLVPE